jgi:hypothetical protein
MHPMNFDKVPAGKELRGKKAQNGVEKRKFPKGLSNAHS